MPESWVERGPGWWESVRDGWTISAFRTSESGMRDEWLWQVQQHHGAVDIVSIETEGVAATLAGAKIASELSLEAVRA